jgi:GxxExxY protein
MLHKALTDRIIKAFFTVYDTLGFGFPESVYQNALVIELRDADLSASQEHKIQVFYRGQVVGEYVADLLVEGVVVVEIMAIETLRDEHRVQTLNSLKASDKEVGLLLNFGVKPEFRRLMPPTAHIRKSTPST